MPYHNLIKAKFSQELHLNNTDCHHKQCEAKELVTQVEYFLNFSEGNLYNPNLTQESFSSLP